MLTQYLVISLLFVLFGFIVFRIVTKRDYEKKQKLSPFSYTLEVLVFTIHANLSYLFIPAEWPKLPQLPENVLAIAMSIIFFVLGLIILLFSWFQLGSSTSFGQDKNCLKTTGIYHYSRNPQMLGYGIILSSLCVLYISWYAVGWLLQYLFTSYFMIKTEEEFLNFKYEEYKHYCSDVPRILKLTNLRCHHKNS